MTNAYDFSFHCLRKNTVLPLSQYRGKVVLLVNTASECGFTPQYTALQKLYEAYREKGLVVLGVPSNDFGGQEKEEDETIMKFCHTRFGVDFPMARKTHIRGENAHPFYRWARQSLGWKAAPKWNFHKYLIDKHGNLADYFHTPRNPQSTTVMQAIERLLTNHGDAATGNLLPSP